MALRGYHGLVFLFISLPWREMDSILSFSIVGLLTGSIMLRILAQIPSGELSKNF